MIANDNHDAHPVSPTSFDGAYADDVIDFLERLPPEEAARVRARAWALQVVHDITRAR